MIRTEELLFPLIFRWFVEFKNQFIFPSENSIGLEKSPWFYLQQFTSSSTAHMLPSTVTHIHVPSSVSNHRNSNRQIYSFTGMWRNHHQLHQGIPICILHFQWLFRNLILNQGHIKQLNFFSWREKKNPTTQTIA